MVYLEDVVSHLGRCCHLGDVVARLRRCGVSFGEMWWLV